MCFLLLDHRRLRVELSGDDLRRYRLTYDEIDYHSAQTQAALLDILRLARREVGFVPSSGKLFVEVYPSSDGCVIYFEESAPAGGLSAPHPDEEDGRDLPVWREIVATGDSPQPVPKRVQPAALASSVCPQLVFTFDNCDDMLEGCARLFSLYCHRVRKSSLYYLGGRYHLILSPLDGRRGLSAAFLSEYADLTGRGDLAASFIEEHGRPIAEENAIDRIAYYFL